MLAGAFWANVYAQDRLPEYDQARKFTADKLQMPINMHNFALKHC